MVGVDFDAFGLEVFDVDGEGIEEEDMKTAPGLRDFDIGILEAVDDVRGERRKIAAIIETVIKIDADEYVVRIEAESDTNAADVEIFEGVESFVEVEEVVEVGNVSGEERIVFDGQGDFAFIGMKFPEAESKFVKSAANDVDI